MEDMNSWDPMKEDYQDSSVNSYDTGPGANLPRNLQPALFKQGPENLYKIYVRGLQPAMNEQSLKNIFHKFGTITDVIIDRKNHYWAILTFTSQEAANNAIQEMNDHSEYRLKVTYARDRVMNDELLMNHQRPAGEPEGHSISVNSLMNSYRNPVNAANHGSTHSTRYTTAANHGSQSSASSLSFSFPPDIFRVDKVPPPVPTDDFSRRTSSSDNDSSKYAPVPVCKNPNCRKLTGQICSECSVPFCDRKCSFEGYSFHLGSQCILVAKTVNATEPSSSKPVPNGLPPRGGNELHSKYSGMTNAASRSNDNSYDQYPSNGAATDDDTRTRPESMGSRDNQSNFRPNNVQRREFSRGGPKDTNDFAASTDSQTTSSSSGQRSYQKKEDGDSRREGYSDTRRPQYNRDNNQRSRENAGPPRSGYRDGRDDNRDNRRRNDRERDNFGSQKSRDDEKRNRDDFNEKRNRDDFNEKRNRDDFNEKRNRNDFSEKRNRDDFNDRNRNDQQSSCSVKDEPDTVTPQSDDKISFSKASEKISQSHNRSDSSKAASTHTSRSRDGVRKESQKVTFSPLYNEERVGLQPNVKALVYLNEVSLESDPQVSTVRLESDRVALESLAYDLFNEFSFPPLDLRQGVRCVVYENDTEGWLLKTGLLERSRYKQGGKVGYRGIITSENPLKVRCVDRGYDSHEYSAEQVKGLPEKYLAAVPFCYRVKIQDVEVSELRKLKADGKGFEIIPVEKIGKVWTARFVPPTFDDKLEKARQKRDASRSPSRDTARPKGGGPSGHPSEFEFNLAIGKPVEVLVTEIKDEKYFYIVNNEMVGKMVSLTNSESAKALPAMTDLSKDKMCLACYETMWYRGRIVSTDPLKVNFIDFGNTDLVKPEDVKCLPEDLVFCKPLAVLVRFAEGTAASHGIVINDNYTLIPVQMDAANKAWIVKLDSKVSSLDRPEVVRVTPTLMISETEMYVCLEENVPKVGEASTIPREPLKSEVKVGLVCHAEYEGDWCRAQVISVSPLKINFIDFGNTENARLQDLMEIPIEWQQLPPMAFKIKLNKVPAKPLTPYEDTITISRRHNEDTWEITEDNPIIVSQ